MLTKRRKPDALLKTYLPAADEDEKSGEYVLI